MIGHKRRDEPRIHETFMARQIFGVGACGIFFESNTLSPLDKEKNKVSERLVQRF